MSDDMVALTIVAPRDLEEHLVELLLEQEVVAAEAGFTTRYVSAFGAHLVFPTVAEQIGGRVRRIEVSLLLSARDADELVAHLRQAVPGRGVSFSMTATRATGVIE